MSVGGSRRGAHRGIKMSARREFFNKGGGCEMSAGRSRRSFHRGTEMTEMQSCGLFWL